MAPKRRVSKNVAKTVEEERVREEGEGTYRERGTVAVSARIDRDLYRAVAALAAEHEHSISRELDDVIRVGLARRSEMGP